MKPYRRFYVFFVGLILIFCTLWVLGVYVQLGNPMIHERTRQSYRYFLFKKERAERIEAPKLIVMSGSNGLYGIGTDELEEGLRAPSVNMSISRSLGLKYILHQTQWVVKSGDWILAPLEYSLYGEEKPTDLYIDYVLAWDPDYFRAQSLTQKAKFIAGVSLKKCFSGLLRAVFPSSKTLEERPSSLEERPLLSLNNNGDTTVNIGQKLDGASNALENFLLQEEKISETALSALSDFIDVCRKNGIQFLATYPSLFYDKAYLSENAQEKIAAIEAFYASKNVPVLGTFEDFLYPIEDMYDSCYHLNAEGREKRTRHLLQLLKPYVVAQSAKPR